MEASEKGIEERTALDRVGAPLLTSLFALFALLFGLSYLSQGVSTLMAIASRRYSFFILLTQLALTFFELLFGVASIVIGAGLFFRKEWARKAWLVFVILTLLVGLYLTAMQFLAGYSGLARVYGWIGLLILVSAISWVYLSKARIKARFH
ncbi:MAG: hypothetical protein ACRD9S_18490 [Pyrinomonadaceae bacterium]